MLGADGFAALQGGDLFVHGFRPDAEAIRELAAFLRSTAPYSSEAVAHLAEAQRRIGAVSLVHRRLYSGDSVEVIDLSRYLEELIDELASLLA